MKKGNSYEKETYEIDEVDIQNISFLSELQDFDTLQISIILINFFNVII